MKSLFVALVISLLIMAVLITTTTSPSRPSPLLRETRYSRDAMHPTARDSTPSDSPSFRELVHQTPREDQADHQHQPAETILTVTGQITDANCGSPIAEAKIGPVWGVEEGVVSDTEGFYLFHAPATKLIVQAEGYYPEFLELPRFSNPAEPIPPKDPVPFDIKLVPKLTVRGRFVDAAGVPVAGVPLEILYPPGQFAPAFRVVFKVYSHATKDGRFELSLASSNPILTAKAEGFAEQSIALEIDSSRSGIIELGELVLQEGLILAGTCLSERGGEVIQHGWITLAFVEDLKGGVFDPTYAAIRKEITDGRFEFQNLAAGLYEISYSADHHGLLSTQVLQLKESRYDLKVAIPDYLNFELQIKDRRDRPVSRAKICRGTNGEFYADSQGTIRFEVPISSLAVVIEAEGFQSQSIPLGILMNNEDSTVVLNEDRRVAGVIVPSSNLDPPSLILKILKGSSPQSGGKQVSSWRRSRTISLEELAFEFPADSTEMLELVVTGQDWVFDSNGEPQLYQWQGALENVQAPAEGLVIPLKSIPFDRRLAVVLEDASGPLSNISVQVENTFFSNTTLTDSEGRAEFDYLPAQTLSVSVWRFFSSGVVETEPFEVTPDDQEIRMVLDTRSPRSTGSRSELVEFRLDDWPAQPTFRIRYLVTEKGNPWRRIAPVTSDAASRPYETRPIRR